MEYKVNFQKFFDNLKITQNPNSEFYDDAKKRVHCELKNMVEAILDGKCVVFKAVQMKTLNDLREWAHDPLFQLYDAIDIETAISEVESFRKL